MPYPASINTTFTDNTLWRNISKIWSRSGNLYFALYHFATSPDVRIAMWKSTDDGLTWTEQDTGNRPRVARFASATSLNFFTVGHFDDGTDMWFVYCPGAPGPDPPVETHVVKFDVATDTWGTAITGGPQPESGGYPFTGDRIHMNLVVRPSGDIVVIYPYYSADGGWRGIRAAVYDSGATTWGSEIEVFEPWNFSDDGSEDYLAPYDLYGAELGADGRVRIFGTTDWGYTYATLEDGAAAVTNYRRMDEDNSTNHFAFASKSNVFWGLPIMGTLCETAFFMVPVLWWTDSLIDESHKPGLIMIEDTATPYSNTHHMIEFEVGQTGGNSLPCAVAQDASTGFIYLVWVLQEAASNNNEFYYSSYKGQGWSAPVMFWDGMDYSTYDPIDEISVIVEEGIMKMVVANSNDSWYWQGEVTGTATNTCSGGGPAEPAPVNQYQIF